MKKLRICLPVMLMTALMLLGSCGERPKLARVIREAGDNRYELKNMLLFFQIFDRNPEKLRAAEFLIENMPAHYSYEGTAINDYYAYASEILADATLTPEQQRDSLLMITDSLYRDLPLHTVPDMKVVRGGILIKTIRRSYDQWKNSPWAKHLTFDEYLEWLLPYKAAEYQAMDYWRDTLLAYFGTGLQNAVKNDVEYGTTKGVADMIRNEAYNKLNRYGLYTRAGLPLLNAHLQVHQTFGNIPDYALTAVLAYRAAGIPAVLDETPVGSRYTAATKWYVILDERGQELTSEWDLATFIGGAFFPNERGPKVYRNTYAIDKRREQYKRRSNYKYPFDLGKKDVTSKYFLTSDLELSIDRSKRRRLAEKYVYIASAVRDADNPWRIVDFGDLHKGKACFRNMGREVLYTVMGYDGDSLIEITEPFILHKDGSMETISSDTLNSKSLDKWKNNAL